MEPEKVTAGESVSINDHERVVKESCGNQGGRWYCCTHQQGFENQFMKDAHLNQPGPHRLAWLCNCGEIEVP